MPTIPASALQPHVDVAQASHHLEILFGGSSGFGSLILLGAGRRERHSFFNAEELHDDPSTVADSCEALQDVVNNRWNVYTSMATFTDTPDKGRGKRTDVSSVPGVWADIDVKPDTEGYFTCEDDVANFLQKLPRPTLEIASGSGGRHLYWLTHTRVEARAGQELLLAWLDFLRSVDSYTIENVHDTTRILRLAGTVRWPKLGETITMPRKVEILNEGPLYHTDELTILASPAHAQARKKREDARQRRSEERDSDRGRLARRGLSLETFERVVMVFNAAQDWEPLLLAAGWTLHSDEREGSGRCRYWTRPGKSSADGKSASTDFVNGDGATSRLMSVYTKDPSLLPLWENADSHDGVGLVSKWKFATKSLGLTDTALFHAVRKTGILP